MYITLGRLTGEAGATRVGGVVSMKCSKCDGLMVLQSFFDHFLNFSAWKCMNCGKIVARKEKTIETDVFSLFYQQQRCHKS